MLQARHNELIKLAITERDKILLEVEVEREKIKVERETCSREFEAELKRIEEERYTKSDEESNVQWY